MHYPVCATCGGAAEVLRVPRSSRPFSERLQGVWRYPLSRSGLITLFAAGLVLYVFSFGGARGEAIGNAILWSYVFLLIRKSAQGSDDIEPPDFTDLSDLAGPALRGIVATALIWVPAALYAGLGIFEDGPALSGSIEAPPTPGLTDTAPEEALPPHVREALGTEPLEEEPLEPEWADAEAPESEGAARALEEREAQAKASPPEAPAEEHGPLGRAVRDPIFWLLVLLGVLWGPAAIIVAAANGPLLQMLNPLVPLSMLRRIPGDYLIAVGASLLLAVVDVLQDGMGGMLSLIPIPVLPSLAASCLNVYVPLVVGRVFGLLLYVRGAEVGFLTEEETHELALPGAEPAAADPGRKEEVAQAPALPHRAPISLQPEAPAARPAAAQGTAAPAGAAAPVAPARPSASAAEALARALAAHDVPGAVKLYRDVFMQTPGTLDPALHLEVGRTAATQGDYPLAVQALRAACAVAPAGPMAPRACVLLARVLGERMGDVPGAQRVYSHVVKHYPGTEAARFALQQLRGGGS